MQFEFSEWQGVKQEKLFFSSLPQPNYQWRIKHFPEWVITYYLA